MNSPYTDLIRETLARRGRIGFDPRHIEAYMRLEHPTLDGLSPGRFAAEVEIAAACVREGGIAAAERNAKSFGL